MGKRCKTVSEQHTENTALKVHKCDIFDLLDFCDFYTIKSLRVCNFGAKMYCISFLYKILYLG
jgi:hypothetical protein